MKVLKSIGLVLIIGLIMGLVWWNSNCDARVKRTKVKDIKLPQAKQTGKMSLEEALAKRRSIRKFKPDKLTQEQIAQLLWAANGVNRPGQHCCRTVPSAGALYPMEVYGVTPEGIYHYVSDTHSLKLVKVGDHRGPLAQAALGQRWVKQAPFNVVITGNYNKCNRKYGKRATRYVHIEAGHIGQNVLLEAVALGLGTVPVGAFIDDAVKKLLNLPDVEIPLYIIPVGYPAD